MDDDNSDDDAYDGQDDDDDDDQDDDGYDDKDDDDVDDEDDDDDNLSFHPDCGRLRRKKDCAIICWKHQHRTCWSVSSAFLSMSTSIREGVF